jgi:acyl-CoA reductase-like NAD-dependent aldehyde dehydrogenase
MISQKYKLGDPTKPETNLGPVVSLASAERIRKQVTDASQLSFARTPLSGITLFSVVAGAKALIPDQLFHIAQP